MLLDLLIVDPIIIQIYNQKYIRMLPKRKLIKKQYIAPDLSTLDMPEQSNCDNLLELLHSAQPKQVSDAIAAIANLQQIPVQIEEELYSTSTIAQLVKMVKVGESSSLVQTTLFAVNNLCVNAGEKMSKIVQGLFQVGFGQALIGLNSNDVNLIKPILVLMANIGEIIPHKHQYLLTGIQQTISSNYQKYLCANSQYPISLILQFLLRSHYTLPACYTAPENLSPEHLNLIKQLQIISESDKLYKNRAMASVVLVNMTQGKAKQCVDLLMTNFQQFITDMDLQKQYQANFINQSVHKQEDDEDLQQGLDQQQEDHDDDQQQQDYQMLEEQKQKQKSVMKPTKQSSKKGKNKHKKQNNNSKQTKQIAMEQTKQKQVQSQSDSPYSLFIDAVEGMQILLEFIVDIFEDQANFGDEDEDEGVDDEQAEGEMDGEGNQTENSKEFDKTIFVAQFGQVLLKNIALFQKYTAFSFVQGQNLIELILRMMLSLPKQLISNKPNQSQIPTSTITVLTQSIIVSQFKHYLSPSSYSCSAFTSHQIPQQIFIFNLETALQLILAHKNIVNRTIYHELPYLKYQQNQSNKTNYSDGGLIMKVNGKWKQCWMYLLEIYSMFYNPEKNGNTNQQQNANIGGTLKKLIIEIPELQLEQWRGQAIDTLFDIYSNQKYDKIFMNLGFIEILNQILKVSNSATGGHNKIGNQNKKSKKSNKFITAVLSDIQRFIGYKKKMIGF